jgi:hypothetical protein
LEDGRAHRKHDDRAGPLDDQSGDAKNLSAIAEIVGYLFGDSGRWRPLNRHRFRSDGHENRNHNVAVGTLENGHVIGIIKSIAIYFLVASFLGLAVGMIVALNSRGVIRSVVQ